MPLSIFITSGIAFLITTTLILGFRPISQSIGLVDRPNERKVHRGEIPLIGGIAIFTATVITYLISHRVFPNTIFPGNLHSFYFAGVILLVAGMVDDYQELSPATRIVVEIVAALVMIFGAGVIVSDLGTMGLGENEFSLGRFAIPFTIFATVGLINAVNMIDGLDGLAGSLTVIPILGFIVASLLFGNTEYVVLLTALAASISAFLVFNIAVPGKRRALIFLGDSGSMFLGLMLAWFAIDLSQGQDRVVRPAAVLWFLAIPIFDAVCMASRRVMRRRPMFSADKEHLHHIFLMAGFSVTETVLIMSALAIMGMLVGLAGTLFNVSDLILAGSFLVLGLLYFWVILRAWTVMRFLSRSICRRLGIDRRVQYDRRRGDNPNYKGRERRSLSDRRTRDRRNAPRGRSG